MRQLIIVPAVLALVLVAGCDNEPEPLDEVGAAPIAPPVHAPPAEQEASGFEAWDTNQDNRIDRSEYQAGMTRGGWSAWDVDDDGVLTEAEFTAGMYRSWDVNRDAVVDEQEWEQRAAPWFEARGVEAGIGYGDWNTDEAEGISQAEIERGWAERNAEVYGEWDADESGGLDENEWGRGWFDTWDGDDDGYLGEDEPGYWR